MVYVYLILFGVFITFGGAGYFYYTDTQARLEQYAINEALLESAVEKSQETIDLMNKDIELQREANSRLNKKIIDFEREKNILSDKLSKRDLEHLAYRKPGLIEKRINDGTAKAFDDIERITDTR